MKTLLLFLICSAASVPLFAGTVTVEWDANVEPVTGYRVYHGLSPRNYVEAIETTNLSARIDLPVGIHYFAVTAFDSNKLESDFSAEVSCVIYDPIATLRITGPTNGTITLLHSNDLTNWTPLVTITNLSGKQFFKTLAK